MQQLRELRSANLRSAADQFRLSALEARFNSYNELNHRRLRDREEGRSGKAAAPTGGATPPLDPLHGVVVTDRIEEEPVSVLYEALARQQAGAPSLDRDTFRQYIARQVELIRVKTGCESVQFRLAAEDGKLKLKAKPVGG